MPRTNLTDEIDYSAFQTGQGGANYQLAFQRIFGIVNISGRRKVATYESLIDYLNKMGGLEQRNAPSKKAGVPSSILGLPDVGPASARALMEHLEQKGLLSLLKKHGSKPSKHNR